MKDKNSNLVANRLVNAFLKNKIINPISNKYTKKLSNADKFRKLCESKIKKPIIGFKAGGTGIPVIKKLKDNLPIEIKSTFLGAHAYPKELTKKEYLNLILNKMIPDFTKKKLVDYVDIFCEKGYFGVSDSEKIIKKAKQLKVPAKIHVNQFNNIGGIQMAVSNDLVSVDHLEILDDNDNPDDSRTSFEKIKNKLEQDFWSTMQSNWALWFPAQLVNFRFVPGAYQVLFSNGISFIWNIYLSFVSFR